MKSLSSIINPSRFSKYFKKEMRENRKQLLSRSLIMIAILCAFSLITGLGESSTYNRYEEFLINHPNSTVDDAKNSLYELYTHEPFTYNDEASANCLSIFVFGFPIALIICASCMFESMSTKQKKIATLMAPATQFEKYLTRFFTYIIFPIFIYIAGCLIAESLRFIIFSIFYPTGDIIRFMDYSDIIKDMLIKDNMLFINKNDEKILVIDKVVEEAQGNLKNLKITGDCIKGILKRRSCTPQRNGTILGCLLG